MKRSELESEYVKNITSENLKSHKKTKTFCSKLYKKERKKYHERLDFNNATDNKKFWKTVKPFSSDKVTTFPKISLVEYEEIISDESKVANSFSSFFENAIHLLGIKTNKYSNGNYDLKTPVEIAIKKYKQRLSINLIILLLTLITKKMELLKTFQLAVSRMYHIYVTLTKIFPKILN